MYLYHINTLRYIPLAKKQYMIGRTSGDLMFESDGMMSGKHAVLTIEEHGHAIKVYVEDLLSKNRTVVDRTQIPPKTKVRLFEEGLLEVGEQMFLLTSRNDLKLLEINGIVDPKLERDVIVLETLNLVTKMKDTLNKELEALQATEVQIKDKLTTNQDKIKKAEDELRQIEIKKRILMAELDAEATELKHKMRTYVAELNEASQNIGKVTEEIETLKKKIGRLKSLPQE